MRFHEGSRHLPVVELKPAGMVHAGRVSVLGRELGGWGKETCPLGSSPYGGSGGLTQIEVILVVHAVLAPGYPVALGAESFG